MWGAPLKRGGAEICAGADTLCGASYRAGGRSARKRLLASRHAILERSVTASPVAADSNAQQGRASKEEGAAPSCVDSASCGQGAAGASSDAWECVFSWGQSWVPCRSFCPFCPMAQVVCAQGAATPNSKLRPSSVAIIRYVFLYVLRAASMKETAPQCALSGWPFAYNKGKAGNGFRENGWRKTQRPWVLLFRTGAASGSSIWFTNNAFRRSATRRVVNSGSKRFSPRWVENCDNKRIFSQRGKNWAIVKNSTHGY